MTLTSQQRDYYKKLEAEIRGIVKSLEGQVSETVVVNILDYSENHGEYGLAVMDLIDHLLEKEIPIKLMDCERIDSIAKLMRLDDYRDQIELLKKLV